jgi:hypothetical protein
MARCVYNEAMSNYYDPPEPTYCATHGEDCDAEPMDSCPEYDGDECDICGGINYCRCDRDYDEWKDSRFDD